MSHKCMKTVVVAIWAVVTGAAWAAGGSHATDRPTLLSTGPRGSTATNVVYTKVADGDWKMADGVTPAPFHFANGGRDIIVKPGDRLIFKRATFDGHVNVGPIWNFYNDNTIATAVLFEDCIFTGGLGVSTVGKMHVTLAHSHIDGYTGFTPSPDSLVIVQNVSIIAAHGGDAARIGRRKNQNGYAYGSDSRTPVVMQNCLIKTTGPSNPGDHRDALQLFGGSGIAFTNVVFDLNSGEFPGVGEGQNVSLFIEDATNGSVSDINIVDCWFLGSGSYFRMGIQHRSGNSSKNINLIRPRIERGIAPLYQSDFPAFQSGLYKIEGPVYSDDMSPVPLSCFGL